MLARVLVTQRLVHTKIARCHSFNRDDGVPDLRWPSAGLFMLTRYCSTAQIDTFEREVVEMVKPCHGTTTLGFIFQGGVIIAVDSRATMGSYICKQQLLLHRCIQRVMPCGTTSRSAGYLPACRKLLCWCRKLGLCCAVGQAGWLTRSLCAVPCSLPDGEEGDRDQPLPPGHNGRRCSRLPVLGAEPRTPGARGAGLQRVASWQAGAQSQTQAESSAAPCLRLCAVELQAHEQVHAPVSVKEGRA